MEGTRATRDPQVMQKKIRLWVSVIVIFITLAFVGVTIVFNRSQPSDTENARANALVSSAKRAIVNGEQTVLYETSRNLVTINVYGFVDANSQKRILDEMRTTLTNDTREPRIRVLFFPTREFIVEKVPDGTQVSRLKKTDPIRQVELN